MHPSLETSHYLNLKCGSKDLIGLPSVLDKIILQGITCNRLGRVGVVWSPRPMEFDGDIHGNRLQRDRVNKLINTKGELYDLPCPNCSKPGKRAAVHLSSGSWLDGAALGRLLALVQCT